MRARKHEAQPAIGNVGVLAHGVFDLLAGGGDARFGLAHHGAVTRCIDQAPLGRRVEPAFGIVRHAALRPCPERGGESICERVLCRRDIARRRREIGNELAVALPRDAFRRIHQP